MKRSKKPTRKKVLVTGGSGYVGSVLLENLYKRGFAIRVLDIVPLQANTSPILKKNIEFALGDIRRVSTDIFDDVECIIHLAGISDEVSANNNPELTREVNTIATINLAKRAKKAGVKRFIFASSSSIYDQGMKKENEISNEESYVTPSGHYSTSKRKGELGLLKILDKDFSIVILRKGTVFGHSAKMRWDLVVNAMIKSAITQGKIRVFCEGLQWRPLLAIDDAAQAYILSILAPAKKVSGQIFNIATDNFLIKDIATIVQKSLNKYFDIPSNIVFENSDRIARSYRVSSKRAKELFNFDTVTSIEKAVKKIVREEFKK